VLGTLLHEAAHGLAGVRGVRDTSRGGRYHNRRYRSLAQELGLEVQETPPIGWSATTVSDATAEDYRQVLNELADALILWRRSELTRQADSRVRFPSLPPSLGTWSSKQLSLIF
jgi:hypothetical protein